MLGEIGTKHPQSSSVKYRGVLAQHWLKLLHIIYESRCWHLVQFSLLFDKSLVNHTEKLCMRK